MEWIEALQKAITYMEEHLLEEINRSEEFSSAAEFMKQVAKDEQEGSGTKQKIVNYY